MATNSEHGVLSAREKHAKDHDFVSKLDEVSKKKAKEELGERNDQDRLLAVQTFRQWVLEQTWLRTPTDFSFLLRFLRAKKFSQLEARKKLEHFWTAQTKRPEWFKNRDSLDPLLQKCWKMKVILAPLTPDKQNRRVIIVRLANIDTGLLKEIGITLFYKAFITLFDWILTDESAQVNGVAIISDYTNLTLQTFRTFFNRELQKDFMSYFQNGMPIRVKSINIYNEPAFYDVLISLLSPFMSQKIRSRVHVHGKSLVNIYKEVGYECLPDEYLPDDYEGPRVGSVSDVADQMVAELSKQEFREYLKELSCDKYGTDKKRVPDRETLHTSSSYRKLNVEY